MENKKNNGLFYAVGAFLLVYAILTYVIPSTDSFGVLENISRSEVSVFRFLGVIFEAVGGFSSLFIFVLLTGVFYEILKVTGAYDKLVSKVVKKVSKHDKLFLCLVTVLVAVVSSVCGLEVGMILFFPFVISIVLGLGYDKLTALACTFASCIVGMLGATFGGVLYNLNVSLVNNSNGTTMMVRDEFFIRLALLVVGVACLLVFMLWHAKKGNVLEASKEVETKEVSKNKKVWPLAVVLGLVLLIFMLGGTDFAGMFGSNFFATVNQSFVNFTVGGYQLFDKVLGGFDPFGTWFSPTRFEFASLVIVSATLILVLAYKVKLSDAVDCYVEGAKKYFKPALLTTLACSVFVLVFYYPVFKTIGSYLMSLSDTFNVALGFVYSLVGGVFYVDVYYYTYYGLPYLVSLAQDPALGGLLSTMFVSGYSLAMLVAPTSVLLLVCLSSNDVKYSQWLKYIWKLFAGLLVTTLITLLAYYMFLIRGYDSGKAQLIILISWLILILVMVVAYLIYTRVKERKMEKKPVKEVKPKKEVKKTVTKTKTDTKKKTSSKKKSKK